ncbi:MAG: hypothetical protein A07HR60_00199 [uncultured archaeon A07HR60]|nr:MAG: hypothetical protein A07HR60_00199 [uncultured archaeon A07HR60]
MMGRTNPTYRDLLGGVETEWSDYRRTLRRRDQDHFDRLFTHARNHADAAGMLNHSERMAAFWMAVAVEQERRLSEVETRLTQLESE